MKGINGGVDVIALGSLLRVANSTGSQGNSHKRQPNSCHCERGKSVHLFPPPARHSNFGISWVLPTKLPKPATATHSPRCHFHVYDAPTRAGSSASDFTVRSGAPGNRSGRCP